MSHHKKKHKVKTQNWYNGQLLTVEEFFDSIEEAMIYAEAQTAPQIKVYDDEGMLVTAMSPANPITYA
jgi:hypothetical protein